MGTALGDVGDRVVGEDAGQLLRPFGAASGLGRSTLALRRLAVKIHMPNGRERPLEHHQLPSFLDFSPPLRRFGGRSARLARAT